MTTPSRTPLMIDQPHHWIIQLPPALGGKGVYTQRKFCLMASDNPMAAYEEMIVFLCEQLSATQRALDVAVGIIDEAPHESHCEVHRLTMVDDDLEKQFCNCFTGCWKRDALARIEAAASEDGK